MFRVGKRFRFETSHTLPNHDGPCRNSHGHSYIVEFEVEGMDLERGSAHPKEGMLLDFRDLKSVVAPLIEKLDHDGLLQDRMKELCADLPGEEWYISTMVSTAELLAKLLFYLVRTKILGNAILHRVRVLETDSTWAEYIHDDCPLGRRL